MYFELLKPWTAPESGFRTLVITFEEFKSDPVGVLRERVLPHCHLDDFDSFDLDAALVIPGGGNRKPGEYAPMPASARRLLTAFFNEENARLPGCETRSSVTGVKTVSDPILCFRGLFLFFRAHVMYPPTYTGCVPTLLHRRFGPPCSPRPCHLPPAACLDGFSFSFVHST